MKKSLNVIKHTLFSYIFKTLAIRALSALKRSTAPCVSYLHDKALCFK